MTTRDEKRIEGLQAEVSAPQLPAQNETVTCSLRYPDHVCHLPSLRCGAQEPHHIDLCGEFERFSAAEVSAPQLDVQKDDLTRTGELAVQPSPQHASDALAICERCQMRLPERLVTYGIGVRGGAAARCAACNPQPGLEGEANRLEVVAMRRARNGAT